MIYLVDPNYNNSSIFAISFVSSGVIFESYRATTFPFLSSRNLLKFQVISPGKGDSSVRYRYSG